MQLRAAILRLGSTAVVWALLGLSAVYWGLLLTEPPAPAVAPAAPAVLQIKSAAIAAWLGAPPESQAASAPAQARRYELRGVIAQGTAGVAVLSIDGQPARPYAVGTSVEEGVILRAVGARHAELAADRSGPVLQRLELPLPDSRLPEGMALVPAKR
jgi:general secretion pathway protein C